MRTTFRRRRAAVLVYCIVAMTLFIGLCVLAVDVGRIYVAKSELQAVADAAARYAVKGMQTSSSPMTTATANAAAVAAESIVDGAAPSVASADVIRGTFDPITRLFVANPIGDAVQVTVRQTINRTGAAPLFSSVLLGTSQKQIAATAIARVVSVSTTIQPPAAGNLWLAGMPDNTQTMNFQPSQNWVWDNNGTALNPKQRPLEIDLSAAGLHPGDSIALEGISGTASWNNATLNTSTNTADGDTSYLVANGVAPAAGLPSTSSNGMSNTRAPIGAVMAVFLNGGQPDSSAAPPNLDFGTAAARDYTSISPLLKQVFYVGDGKRSTGETQTIVIPPGATRVFLGMMDAWQWNDNVGNFSTKMYTISAVQLVK